MRRSKVIQVDIWNSSAANSVFEKIGDDGSIPVVLIPKYSEVCSAFISVPSGVWVLYQKWTAHQGLLPAGLKCCWPAWYRISHIVTKAARTYNHPAKKVPTKDNVLVDIDLSLTFQIGPDEEAPVKFVYELGAQRFDDLISMLTDEAIRALVNAVTHDRVHDLREDFAQGMMATINRKVSRYGVNIRNVKVTNVNLPKTLNDNLENTTAFKTRMEEEEKKHQNRMRLLTDEASKKLMAIQKENARSVQEVRAARDRALITREEELVSMNSRLEVALTNMRSEVAVQLVEAEGELQAATAQGEKAAEEMVNAATVAAEASKVRADQNARTRIVKAEAQVAAAQNKASAVLADARAEEKVGRALAEKRQFEVDTLRLEAMSKLALSSQMVIGGETGEMILQAICPGSSSDMGAGSKSKSFVKSS